MQNKFKILLLDTKSSNPNHYICVSIFNALKNDPRVEFIIKADYSDAINIAQKNNCNFFLAFDGEGIETNICTKLALICGTSAVWYTEDPYEINVNKLTSKIFDFVFTNDSACVRDYTQPSYHLPFAGSKLFHFQELPNNSDESNYLYDLFFAGTAWPNRVNLIKNIISEISDLNLKIALPINSSLPKFEIDLPESTYLWRTPITEFCKFSNKSKITLFTHRVFSTSGERDTASTPGPRLFEVAMAGGFQLVDMNLPEVTEYFTEGEDFIGFKTHKECIDKIKYYLNHPLERYRIAQNAQKKAIELHTYEKRIQSILNITENYLGKKKNILSKKQKTVLQIIHNTIENPPFGGTEIYCDLITKGLKNDFVFLTLTPSKGHPLGQQLEIKNQQGNILKSFIFNNKYSSLLLCDEERESVFASILLEFEIDLVHFQHFIGIVPSLPYIARALGVKTIFTVHDYYLICSQFNLIDYKDKYCEAPKIPLSTCDTCLHSRLGVVEGSQQQRRAYFTNLIEVIDLFIFNTIGAKNLIEEVLKIEFDQAKVRIIPPPATDMSSLNKSKLIIDTTLNKPLKIALIGNLAIHKGSEVFLKILEPLRNEALEFHVYGFVNHEIKGVIDSGKYNNVILHGPYSSYSAFDKLQCMDLSLHISIWPETYCITLTEAWQAGVVPIVSNIGALGERVENNNNGFKIAPNNHEELIHLLKSLIAEPQILNTIKKNIENSELFISQNDFIKKINENYTNILPHVNLGATKEGIFSIRTKFIRPWINSSLWAIELPSKSQNKMKPNLLIRILNLLLTTLRSFRKFGVKKTFIKAFSFINQRIN